MKAILLAAGLGTRLRPITNSTPKCLVGIAGKPLLQYWLDDLYDAGISNILINTHHLSEQVEDFVSKSRYNKSIELFHEPDLLGTLGTLRATQNFWENDNVLIAHADNLCLCDWREFFSTFEKRPAECVGSMMTFHTDNPQACGIVETDQDGKLIAFHEKVSNPPSDLANAAIYLFDQRLKEEVRNIDVKGNDLSIDLMPRLSGKLTTWHNDGYLRDIGNATSLKIANEYLNMKP